MVWRNRKVEELWKAEKNPEVIKAVEDLVKESVPSPKELQAYEDMLAEGFSQEDIEDAILRRLVLVALTRQITYFEARRIAALPTTLQTVFTEATQKTGMVFFAIASGKNINPKDPNKLMTMM